MAALAPMPNASDRTATMVTKGDLRSVRMASRRLAMTDLTKAETVRLTWKPSERADWEPPRRGPGHPRISAAAGRDALAAIIGYEREISGKSAGLRTHMLVASAPRVFVLAPIESGMNLGDVSRVLQGIAAGIGFIGAGAILKGSSDREAQGLTTAAGVWLTAAVGMTAGMGRFGLAVMSVVFAWVILAVLSRLGR